MSHRLARALATALLTVAPLATLAGPVSAQAETDTIVVDETNCIPDFPQVLCFDSHYTVRYTLTPEDTSNNDIYRLQGDQSGWIIFLGITTYREDTTFDEGLLTKDGVLQVFRNKSHVVVTTPTGMVVCENQYHFANDKVQFDRRVCEPV
jgi:hypothetical protein